MPDPKLCSMPMCDKPIGPDALEFTHKGEPAGAICENCLADSKKVRIYFTLSSEGIYTPEELSLLESLT